MTEDSTGAHAEYHVRATLAAAVERIEALAKSQRKRGNPSPGSAHIVKRWTSLYLKTIAGGCSPWWAAQMGLEIGGWIKEADLWQMALRGHIVRESASMGGQERKGWRKVGSAAVVAAWSQLRKKDPRLSKGTLDERIANHFEVSEKTVRNYTREAGVR